MNDPGIGMFDGTPDGTTVRRGSVVVRDSRLRRTRVVTAGLRYLARSLSLRKHRRRPG